MYPAKFEYSKAGSVAEAIQILQQDSDAKIIAGGHSLIPLMKLRLARPSQVVDIGGIAGLRGISVEGGTIRIGALTTHYEISSSADVRANCGILAEAAGGVGDPAVRNRGTIGGNVSHADPASDLPTVLTALGASFNLQGPSGSRAVAADDFFLGPFTTVVGADEVLTGVNVPVLAANQVAEYAKMAHPATSFAIVGAAAVVTLEGGGNGHGHDHGHDHDHGHGHDHGSDHGQRCIAARVAVGGLTQRPTRSPSVESALAGLELNSESIANAAALVSDDLGDDLLGDVYASADYRRNMAGIELKHALYHAVGLAHH
jgi:carbon-monoxide dehydrogenase medium subunit